MGGCGTLSNFSQIFSETRYHWKKKSLKRGQTFSRNAHTPVLFKVETSTKDRDQYLQPTVCSKPPIEPSPPPQHLICASSERIRKQLGAPAQ